MKYIFTIQRKCIIVIINFTNEQVLKNGFTSTRDSNKSRKGITFN